MKYIKKFEHIEDLVDFKPYDINTWKYLMYDNGTIAKILNIDWIRTGSYLIAKEYSKYVDKFNDEQDRRGGPNNGYAYKKDYSYEPTWFRHQDLRFNVEVVDGDTASWHASKVTPISEEQFNRLSKHDISFYNESDTFSGGGSYPGPSVVGPDNAWAGGTIGGGPGFGQTGVMGGEYPKKFAPPGSEKTPFKQNIKMLKTKESKKRRSAIKKLQRLNMMSFNDFNDKNKNEK